MPPLSMLYCCKGCAIPGHGGSKGGRGGRELVRINHHRNCLLCHPPANTPDIFRKLEQIGNPVPIDGEQGASRVRVHIRDMDQDVLGSAPLPTEPFPPPSDGYRLFSSPDIVVRADVTYLRQDFSIMHKAENAHPWPEMQRFDYLVRRRVLSDQVANAYRSAFAAEKSPYRQIALDALRCLTGLDAGESAEAWRKALAN